MNDRIACNHTAVVYRSRDTERDPPDRKDACLLQLVLVALLSLLFLIPTSTVVANEQHGEVMSGVLEFVKMESGTIQIRNSLGQPIFLKIRKLQLLEHVTPGDRVTVVVNEDHEIVKLIETPIPELPTPPAQ